MNISDGRDEGTPEGSTVREAVTGFLRDTGMTTVFGNPGSTELRMFRYWPEDFAYVLGLQESTAVAMAAGHALGTGRAAFVSLHSAGGVGHALGAVFNAYRDRVPLVIVAGQQSRSCSDSGRSWARTNRPASRARTSSSPVSPSGPPTCPPRWPRPTASR